MEWNKPQSGLGILLRLVKIVGPVDKEEEEKGGGVGRPGQHVYLLGLELVCPSEEGGRTSSGLYANQLSS